MQFSSVVTSPMLLLQLCISTLHYILASVFSTVCYWRTTSPVVDQRKVRNATTPTSVNYHFTRKCNYKCGFCFHTAKTSFVLPLEEAKRGLKLLKESGKFDRSVYSALVCVVSNLLHAVKFNALFVRHGKDQLLWRRAFLAR